jgi:IS1 family transposase
MAEQVIDRATIRAALRNLRNEDIYYILGEALEMLSLAKAHKLIKGRIDLSQFRRDRQKPKNLLEEIKEFQQASLHGDYYESFDVNWKNCTEKSKGTCAWIFEFNHLLNRCIASLRKEDKGKIREAMEICFGLLRHIDECMDDVIFFADEGGSWQVGADWNKALPAYFLCLSATMQPDEYASRAIEIVDEFDRHSSGRHLAAARRIGMPSQRRALQLLLKKQLI